MKKILTSPWLALVTLAVVIGVRIINPTFVENVRLKYYDTLLTSGAKVDNQQIVLVNIDEEAIDKFGQFPFPRDKYAAIIQELYARNAGLVVFNVLMPENDRFGGDGVLSSVLKDYPVVLTNVPSEKSKNKPKQTGISAIGGDINEWLVQYPGSIANIPSLEFKAAGVGVSSTLPEADGVVRRLPMVVSVNGIPQPSVSLETLRVIAGDISFQSKISENGIEAVRISKFTTIKTDPISRIWISWNNNFKEYSVASLPKDLSNTIVIVGVNAAGLGNPLATPLGEKQPQYIQAAVLETVLSGTNIYVPDWAAGAEIISLTLLSILILFLSRWLYVGIISLGVSIVATVGVSYYLYTSMHALFDATTIVAGLVLVGLHGYVAKFVVELFQKLQIKKQFGTYLSPAMVEKLQKNPELLQLGGDSRELSIMFTDVRGFTTISEHYGKDVQGLTKIMNRYMTAMTAKIIDNNGTLDKYIGDAQMAFWNAPLDDVDHAKHAVKTALEMLKDLDAFNEEIKTEGIPAFGMGLGINTDTVVVGNMGSDQRFDYTCLGDGVNLAARLEGQSKPYGVRIILGPKTAEKVKDEYHVIELDCIAVKGKTEGVKIYTVLENKPTWKHYEFLDKYYAGNWKSAEGHCKKLIEENNEMKQYYENMLARLKEGIPANWDGTFRATSK